jgi:uncharacterized protein YndB with AHSA1/START domain
MKEGWNLMVRTGSEWIERQIRIEARPETVFAFFTDPLKLVQWKGVQATVDPQPGGIYRVKINEQNIVRGEYLELSPYTRIVFTWGWEGENSPLPPGASTVEISLVEDHGATLLTLRHLGLPEVLRANHVEGWEHFLPRLAAAAAGQDPGADTWSMA